MSETATRELIARYLAAFNASDHDGMLACLSEEIVHDFDGKREIGKETYRWFLGRMARHFRAELADIAIMTAPGGVRAAAEYTIRGTYLSTMEGLPEAEGQSFRLLAGTFFEVDEALISRVTSWVGRAALRAELERA